MSDFTTQLLEVMHEAGFVPRDGKIIPDDKWHPAYYGDERGNKCSGTYTMKIVDGNFAMGCFFTRKDPDNKHNWHSRKGAGMTAEERRKNKARLEAYQKKKKEDDERRTNKIARLLTKVFKKLAREKNLTNRHPYLVKKGIAECNFGFDLRTRRSGKELVIPLYGPDGRVYTVQRITTNGKKFLFTGGRKQGCYCPLVARGESLDIILICEGFATGASLRMATGLPVAIAFDSGNLVYVLYTLKAKFPNSRFVLCADNDAWTFNESKRPKDIKAREVKASDPRWDDWREAGMLWNVGVDKARKAAAKCGGASVVHPNFNGCDFTNKPTDFNDLHEQLGLEAVKEQIMPVVEAIPARGEAAGEGPDATRDLDQHPSGGEYFPEGEECLDPSIDEERKEEIEPIEIQETGDFGLNFRCLGHNDGNYFYFSFDEKRIVSLSASAHTIQNLLRLDDLNRWRASSLGGGGEMSDKRLALYAQNAMMKTCQHRGVFRTEDCVRGAGAWMDRGRVIINCGGDKLYVDGKLIPMSMVESDYTYVETPKFLAPNDTIPLTNKEAIMLQKVCNRISWANKLSGDLLAGWLVIAPVCGALEYSQGMEYRPHIWITGLHESGKSTIIRRIVKVLLGKLAIAVEGTTEAKLRQIAGFDARPVIYDEAEPSAEMQRVIELARKATTGGVVGKYGQDMIRIRFAACFSSINPPISKAADESRFSMLRIKKDTTSGAIERYDKLSRMLDEYITPEFADRLVARTIENMDTLLHNIKTFQRAARPIVRSARASEQIGTMLAGLYLLHTTNRITEEEAAKWVNKHSWQEHTAIEQKTEPEKLLEFISGAIVRYSKESGISQDKTLGELIMDAEVRGHDEDRFLRRYGIARINQNVFFASKHKNLKAILRGTDWVDSYKAMLAELDGAEKNSQSIFFSSGVRTSSVKVPLRYFTMSNQEELDGEDKDDEIEEFN